eukprot:2631950-Prymnesium_polylepis.1
MPPSPTRSVREEGGFDGFDSEAEAVPVVLSQALHESGHKAASAKVLHRPILATAWQSGSVPTASRSPRSS